MKLIFHAKSKYVFQKQISEKLKNIAIKSMFFKVWFLFLTYDDIYYKTSYSPFICSLNDYLWFLKNYDFSCFDNISPYFLIGLTIFFPLNNFEIFPCKSWQKIEKIVVLTVIFHNRISGLCDENSYWILAYNHRGICQKLSQMNT